MECSASSAATSPSPQQVRGKLALDSASDKPGLERSRALAAAARAREFGARLGRNRRLGG